MRLLSILPVVLLLFSHVSAQSNTTLFLPDFIGTELSTDFYASVITSNPTATVFQLSWSCETQSASCGAFYTITEGPSTYAFTDDSDDLPVTNHCVLSQTGYEQFAYCTSSVSGEYFKPGWFTTVYPAWVSYQVVQYVDAATASTSSSAGGASSLGAGGGVSSTTGTVKPGSVVTASAATLTSSNLNGQGTSTGLNSASPTTTVGSGTAVSSARVSLSSTASEGVSKTSTSGGAVGMKASGVKRVIGAFVAVAFMTL